MYKIEIIRILKSLFSINIWGHTTGILGVCLGTCFATHYSFLESLPREKSVWKMGNKEFATKNTIGVQGPGNKISHYPSLERTCPNEDYFIISSLLISLLWTQIHETKSLNSNVEKF